jgi:hypothetical protein
VDYTVEWQDNVEIGTATLIVTGIGNYKGSVSGTFEIEESPFSWVSITPEDNSQTIQDNDDNLVNVMLDGFNFTPNKWVTFCVPFDATMEQVEEAFGGEVDIEELIYSTWDAPNLFLMLYFDPRTEIIAGKPYVLKVPVDVMNPIFTNVTIKNITPETITTTYCAMTGVFNATPLPAGDRNTLFMSNNHFYYPTSSTSMPATKCFFTLLGDAQQANVVSFMLDDEFDGITEVIREAQASNGTYYTLQGVKTAKPQKGIYIVNGKKVVVK